MSRSIPLFLLGLLLTGLSGPGYALTLKIATIAPPGTTWMKEMKKGAEVISSRTQGRVKFKFYPSGVMGSESVVHRKIRIGQLHGGAFGSAGLAHLYPDIQAINLPMIFDSFDEVDYVRARVEPLIAERLLEKNFVLLGVAETGFTSFMSQAPMRDIESIRASKLWVPQGDLMAKEAFLSMGLSPIALPIADVFTGLQTGLVETVMVTPTAAIAFQWHNGADYITDVPLAYLVGYLTIKKKIFDKISPDDQEIVRQEMSKAFEVMDQLTRRDNVAAKKALEGQGIAFVKPEPAELEHWKRLAEDSVPRLIEQGALTREAVDRVRSHLETYRNLRAQNADQSE